MNNTIISIFDVKELYDAAFAEQDQAIAHLARSNELMAEAVTLDARYRAQLAAAPAFSYRRAA